MLKKLTKITVRFILVFGFTCITNAQPPLRKSAETLSEALPEQVLALFKWPEESVLSGPKCVSPGNQDTIVVRAKNNSVDWIRKVLKPTWIPGSRNDYLKGNMIMFRNEINHFDTIRFQWSQNGYHIEASQTVSVITIKLTPLLKQDIGNMPSDKISCVKILCRQIINDTGVRYGLDPNNMPIEVPVVDLSSKIEEYAFDSEQVRVFPDGSVAGTSPEPQVAGIDTTAERSGIEINDENRADNPEWANSLSSWGYWWRHVNWWNNGESVGFFILKCESGGSVPDYWDANPAEWF